MTKRAWIAGAAMSVALAPAAALAVGVVSPKHAPSVPAGLEDTVRAFREALPAAGEPTRRATRVADRAARRKTLLGLPCISDLTQAQIDELAPQKAGLSETVHFHDLADKCEQNREELNRRLSRAILAKVFGKPDVGPKVEAYCREQGGENCNWASWDTWEPDPVQFCQDRVKEERELRAAADPDPGLAASDLVERAERDVGKKLTENDRREARKLVAGAMVRSLEERVDDLYRLDVIYRKGHVFWAMKLLGCRAEKADEILGGLSESGDAGPATYNLNPGVGPKNVRKGVGAAAGTGADGSGGSGGGAGGALGRPSTAAPSN